jgi:hypothetical protein
MASKGKIRSIRLNHLLGIVKSMRSRGDSWELVGEKLRSECQRWGVSKKTQDDYIESVTKVINKNA